MELKQRFANFVTELLSVVVLVAPGMAWAEDENNGEARWSFTPYVWLMDTTVDMKFHDQSIDQEIKFTDIIDKVEFAFQGHLERNTDRFGIFADVTYFSIADDATEHGVKLDADIKLQFYELGALYHLSGNSLAGISVLGGLRHVASEQDIKLRGEGDPGLQHDSSNSVGLTDAMLGARYVRPISGRWQLGFRGDYSAGDTDGTWNFQALIGRQFRTKRISGSALFGYRYMQMDIENGPIESEYTLSGPIVGMRIEF
ncbi:MAG: hypothetical protein V7754_18055 [Halioglobus sp.]